MRNDDEGFSQYLSKFMKPKVNLSNFETHGESDVSTMDSIAEELIEARRKIK